MNKKLFVICIILLIFSIGIVGASIEVYINWESLKQNQRIINPNPDYTIVKEMGAYGAKYNDFYYDSQWNAFFFEAKREDVCNTYGCFFGNHPFYITPFEPITISTTNFRFSYSIYFKTKNIGDFGTYSGVCLIDDKIQYGDFTRTYGSYKYSPDPNHKMICLGYRINAVSKNGDRVSAGVRNLGSTWGVLGTSLSTGKWYRLELVGYVDGGSNYLQLNIYDENDNLLHTSKTVITEPFSFTARYIMYYSGSGGYTTSPYGNGYIKDISVEFNQHHYLDRNIIKIPRIIELKNGQTQQITYLEYSHTLTVYNPNDYDLIDYQVKIVITEADVGNQVYWIKEGSIRLYDNLGNELPYWVEEWNAEDKKAVVWTKLSSIPAQGTVKLTLKSSLSYDDKSDGESVFDFFDDFDTYDTGVSNPDGWTYVQLNYNSYGITVQEDSGRKVLEIKGVANDNSPHNRHIYARHDVVVNTKSLVEFCHKENDDDSNLRVKLFVDGSEVLSIGGITNDYIISSVVVDRASNIQVGHYFSNLWSGTIISYIDWFRIRKYADEKPIVVYGDSLSEFSHSLTVYNPNDYGLTDYQVKITITEADVGNQFYWDRRGSIRLYDSNGAELPYWVEEWDAENRKAVIWIKVPSIPAGGSVQLTLKSYFFYDDMSNPEAVFDFYDDFEGTTLDTNKWTPNYVNTVKYELTGSELRIYDATKSSKTYWIYDTTDTGSQIKANINPMDRMVIEWRQKMEKQSSSSRLGQVGIALTRPDNGIEVYVPQSDHHASYIQYYVGVYTWVDGSSYGTTHTITPDKYYIHKIIRNGNTFTLAVYDEVTGEIFSFTGSTSAEVSNMVIGVGAYGGYGFSPMRIDWVRIRKYADKEPVVIFVS